MLSRFLTLKDAVIATVALIRSDLNLTDNDWDVIAAAVPILKMFYEITVEISSEKNVTLSKVIPLCKIISQHIKNLIRDPQQINLPEIRCLLESLNKEIDRRFANVELNQLNAEATILDPRFKGRGFKERQNYEKILNTLKVKVGASTETCVQPIATPIKEVQQTPTPCTSSVWKEFDDEVAKLTPANATAAGIIELNNYMQEPLLPRTKDPFTWWHERRSIYPHLFNYVQKRLNLVATSVPCERIFSKAGYTLNERRSRLTTSKLSQLLFINCNSHHD